MSESVVDPEIYPAPGEQARFLAFLSGERDSARFGCHEPQSRPEQQVAPSRFNRNLEFRTDLEFADGDTLPVDRIVGVVTRQDRLHPIAGTTYRGTIAL